MWKIKKGTAEYFSFQRGFGPSDDDFEQKVESFLEEDYYDSSRKKDRKPIIVLVCDELTEVTVIVEIPHTKLLELVRKYGDFEAITDFDIPLLSEEMLPKECRRKLYDLLLEMGGLKKQKDVYLKEKVDRWWNTHPLTRRALLVTAILACGLFLGGIVAFLAGSSEESIWPGEAIAKQAKSSNPSQDRVEEANNSSNTESEEEEIEPDPAESQFTSLSEQIASCPIRPRSGRGFDARSGSDGVVRYTYQHLIDAAYYYGAGYRGPPERRGQWVQANEWIQAQTGHSLTYFAGSRDNRGNLFTSADIDIDSITSTPGGGQTLSSASN